MARKAGFSAAERRHMQQTILELLAKNPIVEIACQKVGITRQTFYRWQEGDKKYKQACDRVLVDGRATVNDLAESKLIGKINMGELRAIEYWLKHNNRRYGYIERALPPEPDELTPEEERELEQALEHARAARQCACHRTFR